MFLRYNIQMEVSRYPELKCTTVSAVKPHAVSTFRRLIKHTGRSCCNITHKLIYHTSLKVVCDVWLDTLY